MKLKITFDWAGLFCAGMLIPGYVTTSSASAGIVDQQQPIIDISVGGLAIGSASEQKLAQTVTVGISGFLSEVRLPIACNDGDFTIEIQSVSRGLPNGVVLASQLFPGTNLPSFFPVPGEVTFRRFILRSPVYFQAGDQFAMVLTSAHADPLGGCGVFQGPAGDSYTGGNLYFDSRPNPAGQWVCVCSFPGDRFDFPFQTVMRSQTNSPPPLVELTSPANGAQFVFPARISLAAWAMSSDDVITQVEFYAGTNKLAEIHESPFSFVWSNATPGVYSVSARATDDAGSVSESVSASVTISPNAPPSFALGSDPIVLADTGRQILPAWATRIQPGPDYESNQAVIFLTSNDNSALFSEQPRVSPDGTLTFAPAPNTCGSASVTLVLMDDGGTAYGGRDRVQDLFTITVVDATPPLLVCPPNLTLEFTRDEGTPVQFNPTATDSCSGIAKVVCLPPPGSVFPIGFQTVLCSAIDRNGNSSSCQFAVSVLGPRGVEEDVLEELRSWRSTAGHQRGEDELRDVIEELAASIDASRWIDQTHLQSKHGEKVFTANQKVIHDLGEWGVSIRDGYSGNVVQGFLGRILRATRLLATVEIRDAAEAGATRHQLAGAWKELRRGDAEAADGEGSQAVEHWRKAWKHAIASHDSETW